MAFYERFAFANKNALFRDRVIKQSRIGLNAQRCIFYEISLSLPSPSLESGLIAMALSTRSFTIRN